MRYSIRHQQALKEHDRQMIATRKTLKYSFQTSFATINQVHHTAHSYNTDNTVLHTRLVVTSGLKTARSNN